jgi:hypothetical protein
MSGFRPRCSSGRSDLVADDDQRAIASIMDGETTVSLEVAFNAAGEIAEMFTPVRFREVDGRYVATPWRVRCSKYAERSGLLIPLTSEVACVLPPGPMP